MGRREDRTTLWYLYILADSESAPSMPPPPTCNLDQRTLPDTVDHPDAAARPPAHSPAPPLRLCYCPLPGFVLSVCISPLPRISYFPRVPLPQRLPPSPPAVLANSRLFLPTSTHDRAALARLKTHPVQSPSPIHPQTQAKAPRTNIPHHIPPSLLIRLQTRPIRFQVPPHHPYKSANLLIKIVPSAHPSRIGYPFPLSFLHQHVLLNRLPT